MKVHDNGLYQFHHTFHTRGYDFPGNGITSIGVFQENAGKLGDPASLKTLAVYYCLQCLRVVYLEKGKKFIFVICLGTCFFPIP